MSSDHTMTWLRRVIGLVSQPTSAPRASAASQRMCLKERFIAYRILRPAARRSCNEMFGLDYVRLKQVPMPSPARPPKPDKEPVFEHPPVWIHESVAAKCFMAAAKLPAALARQVKRVLRASIRGKQRGKVRALAASCQ